MAKIKGLKLSKEEVSQTIDLKERTGVDLNPETVEQIGQALIDVMVDRTTDGKDVDGKAFKSYKESYVESDGFKEFGKSKNDINLAQSGGMLADIEVLELTDQEVVIGHKDETETAKSYNHNKGDTVKQRKYFGVTESEITEIIDSFQTEIDVSRSENEIAELSNNQAELILERILTVERRRILADNVAADIFAEIFSSDIFGGI